MARYSRSSRTRGSGRSRGGYRRPARRKRSVRRGGSQRIVIQVIGAPGATVPVSAVTLGKKSARVVRRRY